MAGSSTDVITLYEWDWENDGVFDYSSASSSAQHAYSSDGNYTVRLRVWDEDSYDDDTATVTVSNDAPVIQSMSVASPINEGSDTTLTAVATDTGEDDKNLTFLVNWGDLSTTSGVITSGTQLTLSHTYTDNGTYAVSLTITDSDGATDFDTRNVEVLNVAPTVEVLYPSGGEVLSKSVKINWTFSDPSTDDTFTSKLYYSDDSGATWNLIVSLFGTSQGLNSYTWNTSPVIMYSDSVLINATVVDDDSEIGSDVSDAVFTVDNQAPVVSITLPAEHANATDNWYKGTIGINHAETDNNLDYCQYLINMPGMSWTNLTCNSVLNLDTATGCMDGENICTVHVRAFDKGGNVGNANVTFSVDNSAATITSVNLSDYIVQPGSVVELLSDGTDAQGVKSCWAFMYNSTGGQVSSFNLGNDCKQDVTLPVVSDGNYTIDVRVRNNAGTDSWGYTSVSYTHLTLPTN